MIDPVLIDDDKLSKEQLEELAQIIATFNYDYQQIDQHSTWSSWHTRKMETQAILRRMRFIDKLAILYRVADIHDERIQKFQWMGAPPKDWSDDKDFQKNVLGLMGDGMEEARVLR
jgi:hypothetical protein